LKLLCAAAAELAGMASVVAPSAGFAQQCVDESGAGGQTLSPDIGTEVQRIYEELMTAERYQEALGALNALISRRGDGMSAYEKATVYEIRGSVKVSMDDYRGAQSDFQLALDTGGLGITRNNQLRYYIAQLSFQLDDYQGAIRGLNAWIDNARACNQTVDANAYYLLAAAYTQIQPPNYRAAVTPGEQAKALAPEPRKGTYDLLNLIYSELDETTKRGGLLEEMINLWPGQKSYWTQLSGLYNQTNRDRDAFSVLEVAYRAGLLTTESELKQLIQYYSFFENPYRGATMMEREMAAGNIDRTQANLELLSQLWSQAREHEKAIPILREAAGRDPSGDLYYRLGMVLLADAQYAAAEEALVSALNRGRLDNDDTGDAWLLLGTARFSQAGPEDEEGWEKAREAFENAQRYAKARRQATEWITYVDAVADTYERQQALALLQEQERCQDALQRIEQQRRIRELRNTPTPPEELAEEEAIIVQCRAVLGM
jgi:tetratricopeptide (TPR) repeat protein